MPTPWAVLDKDDRQILEELGVASDRAVAVVLGSLVEFRLTNFLKRYTIGDIEEQDRLLGINGPIGGIRNKDTTCLRSGTNQQGSFSRPPTLSGHKE